MVNFLLEDFIPKLKNPDKYQGFLLLQVHFTLVLLSLIPHGKTPSPD